MSSPALQTRTRVTRIAQEAVDKARLTVVPRVRTRAPRVPFVTLVSAVLVAGIVGLLLFNTSMQQASFSASSLEKEADTLAARQQTLRMELDELRDPQRLAQQAQQMGMVIPPAPVFLDLETGKTIGVRTPATPENAIRLDPPPPPKPKILQPDPTVVQVPATASTASTKTTGQQGNQQGKKNRDR
ncbi:hypothetical protein [Nocardioides hwasunensis]|uniref:Cell division protein FtsL n=1 Tax=Nocardioides hwasunensis TaxID=397258 RepID=A0ABR8MFL2_9ACTN|nr:hypothetical protein [Nocardioides hwasunensis]MBD3913455.1 hypothetical protein [Nocardioides hwasunensis]